MNDRLAAGERRTRFVRTFAPGLLLFCIVPVFLWSRTSHSNGVQASSGGSRTHPSAETPGWSPSKLGEPLLRDPVWVYNNWSSYDELSDNIPLTEELAAQAQLGRLAFQALLSDVRREAPNPKGTEYVLKTSFVLRDSTALNSQKRLA